jgi:hypothetical protein
MCFIINEEGKIDVTKEGMQLPEVIALYKTDKREGKSFFKKCITYIFYVYNPEGIFKNMLLSKRRKKVCDTYLTGDDPKGFEENELIQKVIDVYIDLCTTPTERLLLGTINKIDGLLTRQDKVPLTRIVMLEVENDGVKQKVKVEIDNSEELAKVLKLSKEMVEYQELLKKKIKIEKEESKKTDEVKRLYE